MKLNANRLLNYKFSSNNINFKKLKNFNKFPLLKVNPNIKHSKLGNLDQVQHTNFVA